MRRTTLLISAILIAALFIGVQDGRATDDVTPCPAMGDDGLEPPTSSV